MATQPIYVPLLKGKEGEYAALEALTRDIKPHLMPLIEIPGIPYDYANDRPAKSLDEHLTGIALRLKKCWQDGPLYLDLPWGEDEETLGDGRIALEAVLADCTQNGIHAVPVVSRTSSAKYLDGTRQYSEASQTGACLRLLVSDFEEEIDLEAEVDRLLESLGGIGPSSIDLIVDMEDLGPDGSRAVLIARSILSIIPKQSEWRKMILAAASFPEDLSDVDAATVSTLPRREWDLWKTLQKRPNKLLRRDIIFGDYAITHPVPKELDPRTMRMSANIRYTTPNGWLVVKGRNVRQYGFDQYFELCKELIERPEYRGRDFSWGDRYIADCADRIQGPGNATTWRKVGTNHHLTLLAQEIASLRPGT
jgi:hypothetical protein